jgi:hypothetical protein
VVTIGSGFNNIIVCISSFSESDMEPLVKEVDKEAEQSCSLHRCTLNSQSHSESNSEIIITTDVITDY